MTGHNPGFGIKQNGRRSKHLHVAGCRFNGVIRHQLCGVQGCSLMSKSRSQTGLLKDVEGSVNENGMQWLDLPISVRRFKIGPGCVPEANRRVGGLWPLVILA